MADYRKTYERIIEGNLRYVECAGLSTDTKPTENVCTGSWAVEVDTHKLYAFDETSGEWKAFADFGGDS